MRGESRESGCGPGSPLAALLLVAAATTACSDAAGGGPAVTREVVGDTTVVRFTGVSAVDTATQELRIGRLEGADEYTFGAITGLAVDAGGSIYVLDRQALNVRVYSPEGEHVLTFGREGGGPGELMQPNGMAFLSDGRLIVRDPRNARLNVYSTNGESLTTWTIPGGFFTGEPVYVDAEDNVYTDVIAERDPVRMWRLGLLRFDRNGEVIDTVLRPFDEYEVPTLRAERRSGQNTMVSASGVPFWPDAYSTLNRNGEFVGGIADRYAVLTWQRDGTVLRIERDLAPVPVDPAEAEAAVERTTRRLRDTQENWRWDGPQPPKTKPAFRSIATGEDGRIWVRLSQPGVRQPPDADAERDAKGRMPVDEWVEPLVYDVFEPNGDFVGTVRLPDRFQPMVMRGAHVWGVQRDEFDVQYVVRLRAF